MKTLTRAIYWIILAALLIAPFSASAPRGVEAAWAASTPTTYAPDRLLVKYSFGAGIESVGLQAMGVLDAQPLFAAQGQVYLLSLVPGSDVLAMAERLAAAPRVLWAEPDYLAYPAATTPTDPLFPDQWGLDKIDAPEAWDVTTGSSTVAIAIVDSGIDFTHPDLSGKIWVNPGEIAGNGLDDDNNGYIDDVNGWDFVNGDNNPADDNGHGTQVAGIAAAATNNALGIAGVCWNCRIMPVKVMQASGVANYSAIVQGVLYAAQKGARVINLSLGGYSYSNALRDAVQTAADTYGAVVIAGAGNDGISAPFYPAAYESVIAVTGTDQNDIKASFSDYGTWVDVSAPSVAITTTFMGGDYGPVQGTSFAAAFVSGQAGLIWSQHPDWSQSVVGAQIFYTSENIDSLNPGYAGQLGRGRVNAALSANTTPSPLISIQSAAVNGDPLGRPTPGESATLAITLVNAWLGADNVNGTLTTADPYVSITQSNASFGSIPSGGSAVGSPAFAFNVAAGAGYDHPIAFTLNLTANGGYATTINFTITTRSAEQQVGGTIGVDTTWTNDKTYIVTSNVGIAPDVTLTIQAGTDIRFNGNYNLNVGGALVADGTEAQPIRFLSNTGGTWGRIFFDDTSIDAISDITGTYTGGNLLRWVTIQDAAQGIGCNNATPYLSHVTTNGGGVSCAAGGTAVWLVDSDVTGDVTISGVPNTAWRTRASMPTPRGGLGVAAASNGKLYAIGGYNNADDLATVEEYDPATDTWATRSNMPTPRSWLGVAAASNGKIYAIGGQNNSGIIFSTVEEYDPATDTWTTRTDMPTPRSWLGVAAASNGKIYAIGGYNNDGFLATVEEYDPATDTWTTRTSLPTPQAALGAAAASNGKIYAIGGWVNSASAVEYNPATDTWTNCTSLPTIRSAIGVAAASNGKIYAIGGDGGDTVEEYDPVADTWATRASMPTPRGGLGVATASNGKIYAVGGDGGDTVEEFNPISLAYGSFNVLNIMIRAGNLSTPEDSRVLNSTVSGSITINSSVPGYDSLVQNTTAGGGISILGIGTVQEVTVTGGGISIGSGSVLSNALTGGGISVGSGSMVQGNNIENAPGWAIQGPGTVIANRLVGNASGIQASGGLVQGNLVANSAGVGMQIDGDAAVISNTFTGNAGNAIVIQSGAPTIQGNNLEGNTGTYDIEYLVEGHDISADGNWWGTTGTSAISQRIFDFYDGDYNLGKVLYDPPATGPIQTAPAYVRSVTLTPPSPVGIETVTFEVAFSRPMNAEIAPRVSFQSILQGTWSVYRMDNSGLPDGYVLAITTEADGSVWFGTWGGAAHFDGTTWTVYNMGNSGLPGDYVFAITTEADGSVWFGTNGGAAHFDGTTWTVYNTGNSGLPGVNVFAITTEADGSVWFGTDNGGAAHFDGTTWTVYNTGNSGLRDDDVFAIAADADGAHWFGTHDGGAAHFDGTTWTVYNTGNSGLPANEVYTIVADADGSVWFGTDDGGAAHFDGATWTVYNTGNSGLPANEVYSIVADADGSIWLGTHGGLVHFDGTTWTVYNMSNSGLPYDEVHAIAVNTDGSYWFGTAGGGVGVFWNYPAYTIQDNPFWLDETHFQSSYDITALIERGDYRINVAGAMGTDGIAIAPNTDTTFIVDYAGGVGDTTAPPNPAVQACAGSTTDRLYASWSASDPDSDIDLYQYAIGTTPGGTDVVNWIGTSETSFDRSGLSLTPGQTYYISVRARNAGGLWSEAAMPPGVVAGSGTCTTNVFTISLPMVTKR